MSVKHVEPSGYRSLSGGDVYPIVLYCNGIEAPLAAAEEQAKMISKAFNGKTVFVYHNTTDLNGYTRLTTISKTSQEKLIANLVEVIKSYTIEGWAGEQYQIAIFAHSHGAYLLHHALERLDSKKSALISAYTFGGVSMIPKSLAGDVRNYVFIEDKIAVSGSSLYDPSNVLGRVIKIHQRMRLENLSLAAAISQQCVEETYQTLDPIASTSEQDKVTRENKGRRFNQGFLGGDNTVFDSVNVKEHLEEYTRCFTGYRIETLSRPLPPSQPTGDISDLDSMVQQTKKGMSLYGQHSLNSHILPAFKEIIEKLAAELLPKAKTGAVSDPSANTVVGEKTVP